MTQARTYITRPVFEVVIIQLYSSREEKNAVMSIPGFSYAAAARGPVSPRSGSIAGLAYIPPYGEAFPPLATPLTPTPAPTATVSVIAPDGVRVVSLCQWHISISIFRVNNFRKREYVYYYCKLHDKNSRSFVRSCSRKSHHHHLHHHHRGQGSSARTVARPSQRKTPGNAICRAVVVPVAFGRGPRRTTSWTPSW